MKKFFIGTVLLSIISSNLFAHTITREDTDDGVHYTFVGYCSGTYKAFQGNYTPSIPSANVCSNGCIQGRTKSEVINKICNP